MRKISSVISRTVRIVSNPTRLRVRRVNEKSILNSVIAAAEAEGRPKIHATHGGGVANSYGYPADTEGVVAVGFPDGSGWVKVARLPANKVSLGGVFRRCTGFSGLFDDRFSKKTKAEVRRAFLVWAETQTRG